MGQRVKEEENMIEPAAAGRGGEGGAVRRLTGKGWREEVQKATPHPRWKKSQGSSFLKAICHC